MRLSSPREGVRPSSLAARRMAAMMSFFCIKANNKRKYTFWQVEILTTKDTKAHEGWERWKSGPLGPREYSSKTPGLLSPGLKAKTIKCKFLRGPEGPLFHPTFVPLRVLCG